MLYIPKISPVYFKQLVDKANVSQDLGQQFEAIDYLQFKKYFPLDEVVRFQFMSDSVISAINFVSDSFASISISDITPASWAGDGNYVYEASFTPTSTGCAVLYIIEDGEVWESEKIYFDAVDDYIKISYKNSENDYGYVGSNRLISYYQGDLNEVVTYNELFTYENDRGDLTKLRSIPGEGYNLKLYELPYYVVNQLNLIFSCDDIQINNDTYQNENPPEGEPIETSNLFNINLEIKRTDDNYKLDSTTLSNYTYEGNDSLNIESNNILEIDSI